MKILALETTDAVGSVAAMSDGNLLLELELNQQQRTAQSLPPGMKTLLERVGWKPADVQLVALTIGPGSFTGLRIGVTMAKTFAYSVGAEILGVNTLDTIAEAAPADVSALTAVIDAQRGDIVSRSFKRDPEGWLIAHGRSTSYFHRPLVAGTARRNGRCRTGANQNRPAPAGSCNHARSEILDAPCSHGRPS